MAFQIEPDNGARSPASNVGTRLQFPVDPDLRLLQVYFDVGQRKIVRAASVIGRAMPPQRKVVYDLLSGGRVRQQIQGNCVADLDARYHRIFRKREKGPTAAAEASL